MENNTNTDAPVEKGGMDSKLMIPGAIVIAGLIIAGAIMYRSAPEPVEGGKPGGGNPAPSANVAEVLKVKSDDRIIGNPGAKVIVIEYADFQCPFCGKWFKEVEKKIIEQYVKEGKAALIYRDFAFLGEESIRSAEAARCAGDQGKFWDYHNYLFTSQKGENQGAFSDGNLVNFAAALKLDIAAFNSCFDSGKYAEAVNKETADGKIVGVRGTPATFINGELVAGAQPFSVFQAKIEAALKK